MVGYSNALHCDYVGIAEQEVERTVVKSSQHLAVLKHKKGTLNSYTISCRHSREVCGERLLVCGAVQGCALDGLLAFRIRLWDEGVWHV